MHGRSSCPMIYGVRSTSQRDMAPAHRGLPSGTGLDSAIDQGSPAGDPWWSVTLPHASVSIFHCVARQRLRVWRLACSDDGAPVLHAFQAMPHDLDLRHTVRVIPATR
jgi:hypothetical protein